MEHKKIKSFEDACKSLGINPKKIIPDFSAYPQQHQKAMIAHSKLVVIAQALNNGWKPDWKNSDQWKYYPWFDMSGSGFSYGVCGIDFSRSTLGSRLCYQSRELAEYAGKTFIKLYKEYFTL